jgi:putative sigma-54 modulation protein
MGQEERMATEITIRHMDATDELKAHAQEKADRIAAEFPRVEYVHVIIDRQRHQYSAEIVVQAKNHIRIDAHEVADEVYASLDSAVDKAERRLRRRRDKVQSKRGKLDMAEFEQQVESAERDKQS